jgi:hypothetical protein
MKTTLFEAYRKLTDNEQRTYLAGLITLLPVNRRRHGQYESAADSRRQNSLTFSLPDGAGQFARVCKRTFLETFVISPAKITRIVKRKAAGELVFHDFRGGNKGYKYTHSDRIRVRQHIESFPRDVSHYCRPKENDERQYLSSDLNVNRLYFAFKEEYPDTEISRKYYYCVFNKDFPQLKFRRPRVDSCQTCDLLNAKQNSPRKSEADSAKSDLRKHHEEVEEAMAEVGRDFTASTLPGSQACTVTMDLQKVFPLPKLTHSKMYYSRQLACYNFGIDIADTGDGIMCVWHEGQGGRGGNEIATCLLQAFNSGLLDTGKPNLVVWSDNCAGQLKNRMVLFLHIFLIISGRFTRVDHKFLFTGHTFSQADRDFAVIETRARKVRYETPSDVMKVIRTARPSKPFRVLDVGAKGFFDFCAAADEYLNTTKLGISQLAWLRIEESDLSSVYWKKSFRADDPFQKTRILKRGVTVTDLRSAILTTTSTHHPLAAAKKADLAAMLDFLTPRARTFFEEILASP